MTKRTAVSGAELYVLLNGEFKKRKPSGCRDCYVQFPYRVGRHDPADANWELALPLPCPEDCRATLEQIVAEYGQRYDLDPSK